jgi:hypothetical protein
MNEEDLVLVQKGFQYLGQILTAILAELKKMNENQRVPRKPWNKGPGSPSDPGGR